MQDTIKRPKGVTAFAVIEIISAVLRIVCALFYVILLFVMFKALGGETIFFYAPSPELFTLLLSFPFIILGVLSFITAIALLKLKSWSRAAMMWLAGISITLHTIFFVPFIWVYGILVGNRLVITGMFIMSAVYNGILIWYFRKPEIKIFFKR